MTSLVRIFETLTGKPHRYEESRKVIEAIDDLKDQTTRLLTSVKYYAEAADPIVAFMIDVFNYRAMQHHNGDDKNEEH